MSLFVCDECGSVENTALSRRWLRTVTTGCKVERKALCSGCNPDIGVWHDRFPREQWDGKRTIVWLDGDWIKA